MTVVPVAPAFVQSARPARVLAADHPASEPALAPVTNPELKRIPVTRGRQLRRPLSFWLYRLSSSENDPLTKQRFEELARDIEEQLKQPE